jgi:hypothetical protein
MRVFWWVLAGLAVWVLAGIGVALLLGRIIRRAEREQRRTRR